MPSLCCVPGCKSNSKKTPGYIKRFMFPKDEKLQKQWLLAIGRPNLIISPTTNVCIKHFAEEHIKKGNYFFINGVHTFLPNQRWALTEFAIPTIFPNGKKKKLKEKSLRRDRDVKIVNEPVFDDNNSETESAEFDIDVNNKRIPQSTFDENMETEDETIQSKTIKFHRSQENNIVKRKCYTNRELRVRLKKYKVRENDVTNRAKYNTDDDGLLIENDSIKIVDVKYDGKNYKTTTGDPVESLVRRSLDRSAVAKLKAWLYEHRLNPYPTDNEKEQLAKSTGLKIYQIVNWFINARRRFLPAVLKEEGIALKEEGMTLKEEGKFLKGSKGLKSVQKLIGNQPKLSEIQSKKSVKKYIKDVNEVALKKREMNKEKYLKDSKSNSEKSTKLNTKFPIKEIEKVKDDNKTKREIIFASSEDGTRHVIGHKIIHVASGKVIKLEIYNKKSSSEKYEKKDLKNSTFPKEMLDKKKIIFKEKKIENKPTMKLPPMNDIEEKDPLLINPEDFKKFSKVVTAPSVSSQKTSTPSLQTGTSSPISSLKTGTSSSISSLKTGTSSSISSQKTTTLSLAAKKDEESDKIKHYLIIRNNKSKNGSSISNTNMKKITIALKSPSSTNTTKKDIINKDILIKDKTKLTSKKDSIIEKNESPIKKIALTNNESTFSKNKPTKTNSVENIKPLNMNFENINTPSNSISSTDYPVRFHRSRDNIIKGICKKERFSKCLYMLVETDNDEDVRTYDSDFINDDDVEIHDSDFIIEEEMEEEILENEFEY